MDPLAVTTSAGRRVSILCDQARPAYHSSRSEPYFSSSYGRRSPTPPLSPDMRRPYHSERSDSYSSTGSIYSDISSPRTPITPDSMSLPSLGKLLNNCPEGYRPSMSSRSSSTSSCASSVSSASPVISTKCIEEEDDDEESNPANPAVKKSVRKYTCHCGKSFTTSGHLARHTRIHTGEKNYECPQPGCGARFSRQDNCMQHFRTHQGGGANKRSARKKKVEAPVVIADTNQYPSHSVHYLPDSTFSQESGLAALASIAMDQY
ncbi:transcriptional repressor [Orbilia oligospora]|uniref:Transcriptional repressor n=1 Tax=Orbilia oligospora TaxID=2813651 RepID=A0A7C8P2Y4_ORBOL|nr:transcriptional repressor [Orbilia oligospora]